MGRSPVRVVTAPFLTEVDRGVAGILVFGRSDLLCIRAALADKILQAGPRLDERAVGDEVLVVDPAFVAGEVIDLGEEERGDVGRKRAILVLGEDAGIEAALAELAVQKPVPEQIVAELFAKEALAADTIESGEDAGLAKLLERNVWRAVRSVKIIEERREYFERGIHHCA
jgi:hypothetical protein